ncbi:UNVERIFIED_ORG: hypothetical protein EDF86_0161 [Pseudomonas psychrophila]
MVSRRQLLKLSALGTATFAAPLAYSASNITMTHKNGSPLGSPSLKDVDDNARSLDLLVCGDSPTYMDRRGVQRRSWAGMEGEFSAEQIARKKQFDVFLNSSGFEAPMPYEAGIELIRITQTVTYDKNDYRAKSEALPFTTSDWATDVSKLVLIGDDSLRQELADSNQNSNMIGHRRRPLNESIGYVSQMMDALAIQVWEFAGEITDKPNEEDISTWDWHPAISAAIKYAESLLDGGTIVLPASYIRCNAGIIVPFPKVSIDGAMCTIDFSAMTSGAAINFVRSACNRPNVTFGGNQAEMSRFSMIGPGRDKNVIGIRLGSLPELPSATGQSPLFRSLYIQGFSDAVYAGSDAYLAKFRDCEFYSNANVLHLPGGESNYGENFSFVGGSAHGNRRVLTLEAHSASVFFSNMSFDFNGKEGASAFYIRSSVVDCTDCHWEMGHINTPVTAPPLDICGDQAQFTFSGGFLLAHAGEITFKTDFFALVGEGATVTIAGCRVFGIQPNVAFASGAGRLITRDWGLGKVSTVRGWGKDQVLMDHCFEAESIQDMVYIQNGIGDSFDWRVGENIILNNSDAAQFSGRQSLRVQKRISAGSSTTDSTAFTIAVPASVGERFHYRFKCLDKHSRGGQISLTMHWGRSLGFDKNGVPRSSMGIAFSNYTISPSATWETFLPLNNINGADDAACPHNADTFFIRVNLNNFNGGEGCPDGGWYSLFFDEFEIYRW